ncbi:MAG: tRNA (adenosine(37)-N6)-threonylcarbamoyltransferase complex dimerization subunit type 1 TsaB [Planctomycetaceae bacterium]|jgi:tRNA threonylcarbamoyladenosine biosynthesis protein TsaB
MTVPEWTLAIETSTRQGSLALLHEGRLHSELTLELGTAHGQSLLPGIARLLQQQKLTPRQLQLVAVSQGPGSYTGLRVGVVCAKLLAWSLRIPLVAVDTLQALAADCTTSVDRLWIVTDAQRDAVYAACFFLPAPHTPETLVPTMVLPADQLASQLRPTDVVRGPAVEKLVQSAPNLADQMTANQITGDLVCPSARRVGELAISAHRRGEQSDPRGLTPVYLRQSSAETQWDRLHPPAG